MKSVSPCMPSHLGMNKTCRMTGKTSPSKTDFDSKEMKACFSKLMEMVPMSLDSDGEGEVDQKEVLQCVIDYIYDLQDTLTMPTSSLCGVFKSSLSTHRSSPDHFQSDRVTTDDLLTLSTSRLARQHSLDLAVTTSAQ